MAKPTFSVTTDDPAMMAKFMACLSGGVAAGALVVGAAAPPPPLPVPAASPMPAPPLAASPLPPPLPVAAAAPPPPPPPAAAPAAPPPMANGAIDKATVIASMAAAVGKPGGAARVAAIVARYNATSPGTPGAIDVVDPVQYANIKAELDAL